MEAVRFAIDALEESVASGQRSVATGGTHDRQPTNKQPTMTIQTEQRNQEWVVIRIADNGMEISEAVQQPLFDPFFTTKAMLTTFT